METKKENTYPYLMRNWSPVKFSTTKLIGQGEAARFYLGDFRHNYEDVSRPAFIVEDTSGRMSHTMDLKGLLDLFRDDTAEHSPELVDVYREVFPVTFGTYLADTFLGDNGAIFYQYPGGWEECDDLEVLDFDTKTDITAEQLIWVTERLLRVAEVLFNNDLELDHYASRYVVSWKARKLILLDLCEYRCYSRLVFCDVKRGLNQVTEQLCEVLASKNDASYETIRKAIRELTRPSTQKRFKTIADARRWFLKRFPGADQ